MSTHFQVVQHENKTQPATTKQRTTTTQQTCPLSVHPQHSRLDTHGISSGRTSARMLIESVFAFEVGAAASRIFSSAIWQGADIHTAC